MVYLRILAIVFAFVVCCCCLTAGVPSPGSSRQGDYAYGWGSVGTVEDASTGFGRKLLATGGFNGTILSNGTFAAGWEMKYNGSINIQNFTQGGINQNQALCAELPSPGDYLSFHCINCSGSGRQPFWLNKTAGFQYYLTQTNEAGYKNATVSGSALQLILQDDTGKQLCHMDIADIVLNQSIDGFQQIRIPFQNYPSGNQNPPKDCRAAFQTATMVGIQSLWPNVQFCVDDFQTLPSMVVTPDTANASNSLEDIAPYQNCGIAKLLSVTPEGNYTNVGATLPSWMHQNISAQSPADGYTLFSSVDTPFRNLIDPVNGSCSIINTVNLTAINSWITSVGNNFGVCLYNASGYTDGQNGATLPSVLAEMCRNLISNVASQPGSLGLDSRCSGFSFDNATQIATFKRTNGGSTIDIPGSDEVCNLPTGVEWVRNSALPGYVPQPGGIDLRDVYSNGLQLGWKVNSTSNITLQEVPIGINGTLAMCANMPASQSAFQFTCQDCPRSQMQPFGIGNTAGFEMWIAAAQYSSSNFTVAHGASPVSSMILQLQNATGIPICDLTLTSTGVIAPGGNLYQATALYQNAQSCVAVLNQAASLSFVMNATAGGAVCVSNLTMLPSQVLNSGVASVAAIPPFPNCPVSSWSSPQEFVQPQSTSQGGNFTVTGYNATTNHNVTGSSDAQTYILYQGVDMPGSFQINVTATNGNCSDFSNDNTTAVDQCAGQHSLCCYDSNAAHYQRGVNDSSLPAVLAQICNDLWLGKTVCQGFVYDASSGIAYFLYRHQDSLIDLSQQPTTCNRPGSSMWLLKAAILGTNLTDDRQSPGAAGSRSGSNVGATAGTVFGILLGVASPAAGAAAWLILTYSYRQAKRRIVLGVFKYLMVEDIADASGSDAANAAPDPSANVQMVALNSRQSLRQASSLHSGLSTVASSTPLTLDIAIDDAVAGGHRVNPPSAEMKQAASEIARQCLRLWDGFLGIHAGSDSAGAKAGVWRGKFDGVRCAVLLLAFRKLNKSLQMHSDAPSCLLQAWRDCKTHRQKQELGRKIALILQGIDVTTAQNLPDKDPEVHDQPRFSWRNLMPWRPL